VLLTEHRGERRRLLDDPSLIPNAVEELLRLTSPVQNLARTTTRDVDVGGTTIPTGARVLLGYGSANRDEREYGANSDCLDVGRPVERMLTFGSGTHFCLGASLARVEIRVFFEEFVRRFSSLALAPGTEPVEMPNSFVYGLSEAHLILDPAPASDR